MNHPIPILLLSDAPEQLTGLARMGRDLAVLLSSMPEFRVGYMAMGGTGRRKFPWVEYHFPETPNFGAEYIAGFWSDFAGSDRGVIMSLWDASRMLWFGQPQQLAQSNPDLARFLGTGRSFAKWGYFPVDSSGPNPETLPSGHIAAISGYDRVCAASDWGRQLLWQSGRPDADWLPHGLWLDTFKYKADARELLDIPKDAVVLGCVMANQARKDWAVAFEAASILKNNHGNRFRFWAHTDRIIHYWNLYALAADYGLSDCLTISLDSTDLQMAQRYSTCDVTMLPSAGEGFGFPIVESLACGVPCVVTKYAGGAELVLEQHQVEPMSYRIDTQHNTRRAVLPAYGFSNVVNGLIEQRRVDVEEQREQAMARVAHLDWNKLKHVWMRWLHEGAAQFGGRA